MGRELESGQVVAGRYQLEEVLGAGGMGVVWAARVAATGERVAIKVLRPLEDAGPDASRRLLREARVAASIDHPSVVRVVELLELDDGAPAIVMERLEGEPLRARLARDGVLTLGETARLLAPVAGALAAAHALGVVHRDLKPENVFLAEGEGGRVEVKLLDFGIAKLTRTEGELAHTAGATTTRGLVGTPFYMSPEQIFGERDVDHRTDVWSLGLLLYECLTGLLPTEADSFGQVLKLVVTRSIWPLGEAAPDLPADVTGLVDRMLSRDREARPGSLREVEELLARHAGDDATPAARPVAARPGRAALDGAALEGACAPTVAAMGPPPAARARAAEAGGGEAPAAREAEAAAPAAAAAPARTRGRGATIGLTAIAIAATFLVWRTLARPDDPPVAVAAHREAPPAPAPPPATADRATAPPEAPVAAPPPATSAVARARPPAVARAPERPSSAPTTTTTTTPAASGLQGAVIAKPPF